jgi:hypothetical protein
MVSGHPDTHPSLDMWRLVCRETKRDAAIFQIMRLVSCGSFRFSLCFGSFPCVAIAFVVAALCSAFLLHVSRERCRLGRL